MGCDWRKKGVAKGQLIQVRAIEEGKTDSERGHERKTASEREEEAKRVRCGTDGMRRDGVMWYGTDGTTGCAWGRKKGKTEYSER